MPCFIQVDSIYWANAAMLCRVKEMGCGIGCHLLHMKRKLPGLSGLL